MKKTNNNHLGKFADRGCVPNDIKKALDEAKALAYQFKITLEGLEPPVWRRVVVPGGINLYELHRTIQLVMGWEDCHLHQFRAGKRFFGSKEADFPGVQDECKVMLPDIAPAAGAI